MAGFDDVYTSQNDAFKEIWDLAQDAISTLKAASNNSVAPILETVGDLHFDPGIPNLIQFKAGSIDPQSILDNINNYIKTLSGIQPPVFPDAPSFSMQDHEIWNEEFMDKLKTSMSAYVDSMGIPDVTYQNAIFNEEYERNLQALNDLYDLADAKTGARGFTYTNDFGNSLKIDAQQKYQFDRTGVSRNISKLVTEWARQNYQFAIERGITHQQAHMDFTYKYCTAFFSVFKDMVSALLERYKAQVELVLAPISALQKELELVYEYSKISAEIDKTNEALKQSRSDIQIKEALQKFSSDTSRLTAEFNTQMDMIKAAAAHSASMAQASNKTVIGITK